MAHTLDHIVELRLEADPSLAWTPSPIALGDYDLPDFSVPPEQYSLQRFLSLKQQRAPLVFTDPAQQASYDEFRRLRNLWRERLPGGEYRREERGEGVIAGGLEYISNIPGEIGEAAGEFVAGIGGGVGAGLGALTAPIVAAPGALLEGIPVWVPLLGAAFLLTRN